MFDEVLPVFVLSVFFSFDQFTERVDDHCNCDIFWILVDCCRMDGLVTQLFEESCIFLFKCDLRVFQDFQDIFFFVHLSQGPRFFEVSLSSPRFSFFWKEGKYLNVCSLFLGEVDNEGFG